MANLISFALCLWVSYTCNEAEVQILSGGQPIGQQKRAEPTASDRAQVVQRGENISFSSLQTILGPSNWDIFQLCKQYEFPGPTALQQYGTVPNIMQWCLPASHATSCSPCS